MREHVKCAWESDMPTLENVQITSYQLGVLDNNASDVFAFRPQGSLPDTDGRDFLLWRKHDGMADREPVESDSLDPYSDRSIGPVKHEPDAFDCSELVQWAAVID